jgi:CDP-diacylglycerol--glycerol-3-phosphate 3-phosphatidyltransferase
MNLPNKITTCRIILIPVLLVFIVPIPSWVIDSTYLGFIHSQLLLINKFILKDGNYLGAIFFIIAACTDKLDGYLARKSNEVTKLGIFLDPVADKLLIATTLIALVQRNEIWGWAAILIISRELIITGFRLVASGENIVLSADKFGKLKMVVQTVGIALVLLKNYPFSLISKFAFDKSMILIAIVITILSGINYIWKNRYILNH